MKKALLSAGVLAVLLATAPFALAVPPGAARGGTTCINVVKPLTGLDDQQERLLAGTECSALVYMDSHQPWPFTTSVNATIRYEGLHVEIFTYDHATQQPVGAPVATCTTAVANGCDGPIYGAPGTTYLFVVTIEAYAGQWSWHVSNAL